MGGGRAGLNEREAPGKIVTARPPKSLAQLSNVSHALVSTLQKHRSKMSKLIRFGSLHFRDNLGWPRTAVRMWLICSNKTLYHKKRSFCYRDTTQQYFCHSLSAHLHCTNGPFTYIAYSVKICQRSLADQNVHRLEKKFSTKYHTKATW